MDFIRQGRYVIPSFIFFLSIVWADSAAFDRISKSATELGAFVAVVTAATLPLGFFIGGISMLALKSIFFVFTCDSNYEIRLSPQAWTRIWANLGVPASSSQRLVAASAFQLEISNNIVLWIDRRWNAFNVYINSITALVLAYVYTRCWLKINVPGDWMTLATATALVSSVLAIIAWRDIMKMTELMAVKMKEKEDDRPEHKRWKIQKQ